MLTKSEDAEEASQETFLKVYTALARFNGRYQLGAWITRIATNVCLDRLRARSRTPVSSPIDELILLDSVEPEQDSDPERILLQNFETKRVRKQLAALPPLHRAAIILRDIEGLSYEEIGVILEISPGQTKSLLHRARGGFKRSWVSESFGFLLPPRLVGELRDIENASQPLVPSISHAGQFVSSCAAVLQQCGQVLVDKAAALVTVGVVGVAVVTSTAGANSSIPAEPVEVVTAAVSSATEVKGHVVRQEHEAPPQEPVVVEVTEEPTPPPAEEEPAQEEPASNEGEVTAPVPSPTPSLAPAEPTPPLLAFRTAGSVTALVPIADQTTIDCAGRPTIEQHLSTSIWLAGETYPAELTLSSASGLSIALTVTKNGVDVYYPGGAGLASESTEDGLTRLNYHGGYAAADENKARAAGLPVYGDADVELTFDCSRNLLISETALFGL